MIKETSNQLKARARGTLLGHYSLPVGATILTTAAILVLEGLITLVVPKNATGIVISYLTMLIAAIFSTLLQTGYDYLLLNMARGKPGTVKGSHLSFSDDAGSCDPSDHPAVSLKPGLHASVFRLLDLFCFILPGPSFQNFSGSAASRKSFSSSETDF